MNELYQPQDDVLRLFSLGAAQLLPRNLAQARFLWRLAMIVVMKPGSTSSQIEHVVKLVREMGLKEHVIEGTEGRSWR